MVGIRPPVVVGVGAAVRQGVASEVSPPHKAGRRIVRWEQQFLVDGLGHGELVTHRRHHVVV